MPQRGFSLIELVVVMAIAGILLSLSFSSFRTMMDSNRTRGAAESLLSGLRSARSEAIRRNAPMRFQLVSTLTASCAYSTSSALWVVTQTNNTSTGLAAGYCDASPFTPPDQPDPCNPAPTSPARPAGNPASCVNEPYIAYKSPGDSFPNVQIAADGTVVTFGPLGQAYQSNLGGTARLGTVTLSIPSNSEAKTWRVRVTYPSGALKLCDPSVAASNPQAC